MKGAKAVQATVRCDDCDYSRSSANDGNDTRGPGLRGPAGLDREAAKRHAEAHDHTVWFARRVVLRYGGRRR